MKIKKLFALSIVIAVAISCKKDAVKSPTPNVPGTPNQPGTETPNQLAILTGETIFNSLPKQVAFGVQANPEFYNQANTMNVKYRYAYLTGDPMNGSGWEKWNSPDGTYALAYMQKADEAGMIPVLSYYVFVPIKYYADPATSKLNEADAMKAYFENWRLLMQKCAEFGKTVVVHYEPDMPGYFQQGSNDPATLSAKVKSSGFTDSKVSMSTYVDNAVGMFKLIKDLRDKYAPKVVLGYHLSQWATGQDLIFNKPDPVATSKATIAFYKKLETDFDVLFSEFSDRDAAWYQKIEGKNRWWVDADFESFRLFLKEAHESTKKRIILWQIPCGNTKYKACNNTDHHYQDNRAEFFFEEVNAAKNDRLMQYAKAGVIAYLFGHGAPTCTGPYDEKNDGIVNNPAPINGNNRDAIDGSKDDEGGYLRYSFKKYNEASNKTVITFK